MMMLRAILFLAIAFGAPTVAAAQQASTPPSSGTAKNAHDPSEIVCEKQEVIGSRLTTKRVCLTRAQWADLRTQDRQDTERVQLQRGMTNQ
jgi:invasion protein IalB